MKFTKSIKNLEKSAIELTVTVEKDEVADIYNKTLAKYVKNAQIPGFRKGHVPANVLERKYGDSIKAEAIESLIDLSFSEIVKEDKDNYHLPYS